MVVTNHITAPAPLQCLSIVIYVKVCQPQKECVEPTTLLRFGLFLKAVLKTHQLLNSEHQVSIISVQMMGEPLHLGILLFSLQLAGCASQISTSGGSQEIKLTLRSSCRCC